MSKKVLGVYHSSDDVIRAIEEFQNDGYSINDLSIIANKKDLPSSVQDETGVTAEELGDRAVSREHQSFIDSLVNVFEGNNHRDAGGSSYYDRLVGMGIDEPTARDYVQDIESGKILLLTENEGASLSGYSIATDGNDRTGLTANTLGADDKRSLKLHEEQLDVTKDRVKTGEVEVHKDVVEEQKTVHVPVTHEEVYVERRPVENSAPDTNPISDKETIRVPIIEEKVEVTKKPVVTEEIVIGKKKVVETEEITENVKREEAKVEKDGNARVNEATIDNKHLDDERLS